MNFYWLEDLYGLIAKHGQFGIEADLSALDLDDLWRLYLHLSRLIVT